MKNVQNSQPSVKTALRFYFASFSYLSLNEDIRKEEIIYTAGGKVNYIAMMKISLVICQKNLSYNLVVSHLGIYPKDSKLEHLRDACPAMFIAALVMIPMI